MSEKLVLATDEEARRVHETLALLICWLRQELGDKAMEELLNKLEGRP